jgi:hypothetical protein
MEEELMNGLGNRKPKGTETSMWLIAGMESNHRDCSLNKETKSQALGKQVSIDCTVWTV